MLKVYRTLLRLYPAEHRQVFSEEMLEVLLEARNEVSEQKRFARGRLIVRESAGLLRGALRERFRMLTEIHHELSFVTGRLAMRNGFRFPKTTIVFMLLILGGVLSAIKRGEDIAASVPNANPPITVHVQSVHSILLGGMPLFFAFFYAAGLIGWAILFALRRSGVHRLAGVSTEQK
jgi:hypothetical protein